MRAMSTPTTTAFTSAPPSSRKGISNTALAARYLEAQLGSDHRECIRLLEEAIERGVQVQDLHLKVIQPCQREIGRLWEQRRISVAQEHLATAVSQLVIAHLYRHLPREAANGRLVLIACVEGEHHDLGARVASDFFEMAGFEIRYLGANVPTEGLLSMINQKRPALVALSVTLVKLLPAFRDVVTVLHAKYGTSLPVLAGGRAFTADAMMDLPPNVAAGGGDAAEMVRVARRLVGVS
jgi:methanogenic corrinoid protein MtbC1